MEQKSILVFLEKKDFVNRVSHAVAGQPGIPITEIRYEVWECPKEPCWYDEVIVVTYKGGAIAVRTVVSDSNSAILEEIGKLAHGGYYCEVKRYREMVESGDYKKVI